MKNMKLLRLLKNYTIMLLFVLGLTFTGCSAKKDDENKTNIDNVENDENGIIVSNPEDELGTKLANLFLDNMGESRDVLKVAEVLGSEEICGYDCAVVECEEGYLNGFTDEVKGFGKGASFAPWIGSIPFVGYIFETDNIDELKSKLTDLSDSRWNICTEANDPVMAVYDNYLFFVMTPKE